MSVAFERSAWMRRVWPYFQGFDLWLLGAVLVLCVLGLVTMYSSGYDHGTRFYDHLRNMCIAALVMFMVAQVPPQKMMSVAVPLYAVGVTLLIAVAIFGITKKGAKRWLNVGLVIQPSEILKIAMPLMLAWWFQKREGILRAVDFVVAALLLCVPVFLIMRQPDLGTSLLVFATGASVLFFAGLNWKLIVPPVLIGVLAVAMVVAFESDLCASGVRWPVLHDYQQQRICTLLNPTRDPLGKGFHIIQGMIAIGSGGLTGKGFMAGTQTHLEFIPERTTDFIFAVYSEEFGLLGNIVLISSLLFLIFRALMISMNAPLLFSRLLAGSMAIIFFTYSFVNLGMVSGILPVVGVPLPFISYGGTAMVTLGMALGILMSVSRSRRKW